ncbi:MAG: glycosyltransferase family 4 protein [Candidatus Hodarchaeota archaeon]
MKVTFVFPLSSEWAHPEFVSQCQSPDQFDLQLICNAENVITRCAKLLNDAGVEVCIYYLSQFGKEVKEFQHKFGFRLIRTPVKFMGGKFGREISPSLFRKLYRESQDIIHVHGYYGNDYFIDIHDMLAFFCKFNHQKFVLQYRGGEFPGSNSRKKIRYILKPRAWVKRKALEFADMVLSINSLEIERLTNPRSPGYYGYNINKEKVKLLPNTVNVSHFRPIPKHVAAKILKKDSKKPYLLYVGRLVHSKGIHHLISILPKLQQNVELLIIGEGSFKDSLIEMSARANLKDRIKFIGFVQHSDLVFYYNLTDVLVLPTHNEAFGAILIEALACDTPSVATCVGGIPEILSDGVGLMVPPTDETALLEAIDTVLSKRFHIDQVARSKKLQMYSEENVAKQLIRIYEQILQ